MEGMEAVAAPVDAVEVDGIDYGGQDDYQESYDETGDYGEENHEEQGFNPDDISFDIPEDEEPSEPEIPDTGKEALDHYLTVEEKRNYHNTVDFVKDGLQGTEFEAAIGEIAQNPSLIKIFNVLQQKVNPKQPIGKTPEGRGTIARDITPKEAYEQIEEHVRNTNEPNVKELAKSLIAKARNKEELTKALEGFM